MIKTSLKRKFHVKVNINIHVYYFICISKNSTVIITLCYSCNKFRPWKYFIIFIIFMADQSKQKLSLLFFLVCKQFLQLQQFLWTAAEVPLPNQTIMQNCGKNFDAITNLPNCRTKFCYSNNKGSNKLKSSANRIKAGRVPSRTHWIFYLKLTNHWSFQRTFSIERVITKYHCFV